MKLKYSLKACFCLKYVSKVIFLIPLIFYVYKGRTKLQMPDDQYKNNDSINAIILNLLIP